jgi:YD repeat-containing protein
MRIAAPGASRGYSYWGIAFANPDAVTQIANGNSTSTFSYDNAGNLTQKVIDGRTTTYTYDYLNRLTALVQMERRPTDMTHSDKEYFRQERPRRTSIRSSGTR